MDVIEMHRKAGEYFRDVVRRVPAGGWGRPTPCSDWDVRALVNHVVGEDRWTVPLMAGRTIAEVGDTLDGDLLGDDPVDAAERAWAQAAAATAPAVRAAATVQLSYGAETAAEYASQLAADHLIHGWDAAVATGGDRTLPADLVQAVAGWYGQREQLYRVAGIVGPRPALPGDASPQDRLLAAFGRDPRWAPPAPAPEQAPEQAPAARVAGMRMGGVTIDCAQPQQLAEFWTEALGTKVAQDYDGEYVVLAPVRQGDPFIGLQRVPEPRRGKNRAHMDFFARDRPAEVQRLVGLGATVVQEHGTAGMVWTVLADPEGNEFCVCTLVGLQPAGDAGGGSSS